MLGDCLQVQALRVALTRLSRPDAGEGADALGSGLSELAVAVFEQTALLQQHRLLVVPCLLRGVPTAQSPQFGHGGLPSERLCGCCCCAADGESGALTGREGRRLVSSRGKEASSAATKTHKEEAAKAAANPPSVSAKQLLKARLARAAASRAGSDAAARSAAAAPLSVGGNSAASGGAIKSSTDGPGTSNGNSAVAGSGAGGTRQWEEAEPSVVSESVSSAASLCLLPLPELWPWLRKLRRLSDGLAARVLLVVGQAASPPSLSAFGQGRSLTCFCCRCCCRRREGSSAAKASSRTPTAWHEKTLSAQRLLPGSRRIASSAALSEDSGGKASTPARSAPPPAATLVFARSGASLSSALPPGRVSFAVGPRSKTAVEAVQELEALARKAPPPPPSPLRVDSLKAVSAKGQTQTSSAESADCAAAASAPRVSLPEAADPAPLKEGVAGNPLKRRCADPDSVKPLPCASRVEAASAKAAASSASLRRSASACCCCCCCKQTRCSVGRRRRLALSLGCVASQKTPPSATGAAAQALTRGLSATGLRRREQSFAPNSAATSVAGVPFPATAASAAAFAAACGRVRKLTEASLSLRSFLKAPGSADGGDAADGLSSTDTQSADTRENSLLFECLVGEELWTWLREELLPLCTDSARPPRLRALAMLVALKVCGSALQEEAAEKARLETAAEGQTPGKQQSLASQAQGPLQAARFAFRLLRGVASESAFVGGGSQVGAEREGIADSVRAASSSPLWVSSGQLSPRRPRLCDSLFCSGRSGRRQGAAFSLLGKSTPRRRRPWCENFAALRRLGVRRREETRPRDPRVLRGQTWFF